MCFILVEFPGKRKEGIFGIAVCNRIIQMRAICCVPILFLIHTICRYIRKLIYLLEQQLFFMLKKITALEFLLVIQNDLSVCVQTCIYS